MTIAAAPKAREIAAQLRMAILRRRLRPGTRLKEEELAEVLAVSRARVRQALALLEQEGLVTHQPHRGACVSEPPADEARDVFFARAAIERRLVERLAARATPEDVAALRAHVAGEQAARLRGDADAIVRLAGEFHLLIARLSGGRMLAEVLPLLTARSALILTMYQSAAAQSCGPDEHAGIVDAIAAGDAALAVRRMQAHLDHLESGLDRSGGVAAPTDLRAALLSGTG